MVRPVTVTCIMCKKEITFEVKESDFQDWRGGKFVQDAFPYLSEGQRELLISGVCDDCFKTMFSDEEESE